MSTYTHGVTIAPIVHAGKKKYFLKSHKHKRSG